MDIKKQVIVCLGGMALGWATQTMALEPSVEAMPVYEGNSPYSAPGYQNPYAQPYGSPSSAYGNSYPKPLSPSKAGLLANEEDSPDNISSMPTPGGPAEQAIQWDNQDSYTDPY